MQLKWKKLWKIYVATCFKIKSYILQKKPQRLKIKTVFFELNLIFKGRDMNFKMSKISHHMKNVQLLCHGRNSKYKQTVTYHFETILASKLGDLSNNLHCQRWAKQAYPDPGDNALCSNNFGTWFGNALQEIYTVLITVLILNDSTGNLPQGYKHKEEKHNTKTISL